MPVCQAKKTGMVPVLSELVNKNISKCAYPVPTKAFLLFQGVTSTHPWAVIKDYSRLADAIQKKA